MKLIQFKHREDYGHDFYITLLRFKHWCVFQGCFYTAVYGRRFPYFSLVMGSGRILEVSFSFLNFGFTLSFLTLWWFGND